MRISALHLSETDPGKGSLDSAESPELSPDQLLNEAHAPATYEKLGTETLAGRTTTKYRVVVVTGTESQNETLMWIDEALGMPVRSETIVQVQWSLLEGDDGTEGRKAGGRRAFVFLAV